MRNASGNVSTLLSRQKFELLKAYGKAESVDKKLKTFKKIEKLFPESELGFECWELATLPVAQPEQDDSKCVMYALVNTQKELYNLKFDTSGFDEAVIPLRKALEIQESMMEEGCIQLGETYECISSAYLMIMNYKEAMPFCLKALEIYRQHFGPNSVEVAEMMSHLALIYNGFKEYEKALEQNQLSQNIFKNTNPYSSDFLSGENDTGCFLIGLGRYDEAIVVLKHVVSNTNTVGSIRGLACVNTAKAFCYIEKFADAKKYMRTAQRIFEKIEENHRLTHAAVGFRDMSMLYENMNDFKNAISLLRRAMSIPHIPLKLLAEGSARLFLLISQSGKEKEGISYMEDVVEILKKKFGAEHCEVGYCYRNLGAAYLKSGQKELAVKFMAKSRYNGC